MHLSDMHSNFGSIAEEREARRWLQYELVSLADISPLKFEHLNSTIKLKMAKVRLTFGECELNSLEAAYSENYI